MDDRKLLGIGILGALVGALCCFTPLLVALLAAVGLSAATGYLDLVVLPAMAAFVAITVYALVRRRRAQTCERAAGGQERA
jgi:mercuric ion transport protein